MGDARTSMSGDWLAYMVIDEIVDDFTRQCTLLQNEVDAIEDLTLSLGRFDQMDMLRRIYQAHRRTTILSRVIQPKLEIVRTLIKRYAPHLQSRTILYFRDVADHLYTIRQDLAEFSDSLDRAHVNYLGQADIELAMASHRMNLIIKKMTALTFMIGSCLAIATIMGVNVRVPFEDYPKELAFKGLLPFSILIMAMLLLVAVVFLIGRNKKWL